MRKKERSFYEIVIFAFINVITISLSTIIEDYNAKFIIMELLILINTVQWLIVYFSSNSKRKEYIIEYKEQDDIDNYEMRDIYHEAGHVTIQLLTENPRTSYIRSVSIIDDQFTDICYRSCSESKENLNQLLGFYMGGFCAEEVIYNISDSNSYENQYDWNTIVDITTTIIEKYGYQNRILINLSYEMKDTISEMATNLLNEKKSEIKLLLQENRDLLEAIANALNEKGELDRNEIYEIYVEYKKNKTIN